MHHLKCGPLHLDYFVTLGKKWREKVRQIRFSHAAGRNVNFGATRLRYHRANCARFRDARQKVSSLQTPRREISI